MQNSAYKRLYDSYFQLYDATDYFSQEEIIRTLLNGPDRIAADMVADMVGEKHMLSIEKFRASMTASATRLVTFVPRAIQVYQLKRIDLEIERLYKQLKSASEEESLLLLGQIQDYTGLRKKLEEKLGRVM